MPKDTEDNVAFEENEKEKVGYKKPPIKGRFRKGESGNKKGRPRGRQNVAKLASKMFDTRIPVRIGETKVMLPYFEALVRVLRMKAMQGDTKSQQGLTLLMEQLGFYDEKNEPEAHGVLVIPGRPLSEEEWYFAVHWVDPDKAKLREEDFGLQSRE